MNIIYWILGGLMIFMIISRMTQRENFFDSVDDTLQYTRTPDERDSVYTEYEPNYQFPKPPYENQNGFQPHKYWGKTAYPHMHWHPWLRMNYREDKISRNEN